MLKPKVQNSLNKQMNAEFYSSYEYLAMSAFLKEKTLDGFSHWFMIQSQEEYGHAMKIYNYIHNANSKVKLLKIEEPKTNWKTVLDIANETFNHEKKVSQAIYDLVELSLAEKDYATNNFLQWFVSEQVEEENIALNILEKLKLIGDSKDGLFLLDRELMQRAMGKD
jgi:ferritin